VVTLIEQGRSGYECRSALLTAGAKAAVLSGSLKVARKALRTHLAQAESGQLEPRDMARFGTALGRLLLPASVREGLEAMRLRPLWWCTTAKDRASRGRPCASAMHTRRWRRADAPLCQRDPDRWRAGASSARRARSCRC